MQNCVILSRRPDSLFPHDLSCFELRKDKIPEINEIDEKVLVVKVLYLSIDPVMRVWMSGAKTYLPPIPLKEPIWAFGIGEVVYSKNKNFAKGDLVNGVLKSQEYCITRVSFVQKFLMIPGIPLSYYLNIIGINGFTAYQGIVSIGKPKEGETVVVSTAAGATGIYACQFAKRLGCRVVGLTGSDEKKKFLIEVLGIDVAINYNSEKNIRDSLKSACTKGIDIYFDNIGEDILDAVLSLMNDNGRIALSGAMKTYNNYNERTGIKNFPLIISKRILMRGFTFNECFANLGDVVRFILDMINEKKIVIKQEILEGIDKLPEGLQKLFKSQNIGKVLIKVDKNFRERNDSKL